MNSFTNFILSRPELTSLVIFLLFAIPVSVFDLKTGKIPDILTLFGTLILLLYHFAVNRKEALIYIMSALLAFLLLLAIRYSTKKGLGWGDIKFGAVCGAYAGPIAVFGGFILAAFFAGIYFFIQKRAKNWKKDKAFPFAPFLALGTLFSTLPAIISAIMKIKETYC